MSNMSNMKEYMLDRVYKFGKKAGLTSDEAEDIYFAICNGNFEAYCIFLDTCSINSEFRDSAPETL